jgi:hypothetical protein
VFTQQKSHSVELRQVTTKRNVAKISILGLVHLTKTQEIRIEKWCPEEGASEKPPRSKKWLPLIVGVVTFLLTLAGAWPSIQQLLLLVQK